MTEDYGLPQEGADHYQASADSTPRLTPPAAPDLPPTQYPDTPQATTLPGGESYRPAPAVMLRPGHGNQSTRPGGAPIVAAVVVGFALLLAAILVSLQLRPVKTVLPPVTSRSGAVAPAVDSEAPATTPITTDEDARSYEKDTAEPTVGKAKAAFRKHSPGIYEMVQEKDDPVVRPSSDGLAFTWSYVDPTSPQAVKVHTFTVELDDKGDAVDYYGD